MHSFERIQRKSNSSSNRITSTSHRLQPSRPFAPAPVPISDPDQQAQHQRATRLRHSLADIPTFPPERENHIRLPDNLKAGIENLSGMAMDDVNECAKPETT